jgi:putative thioredoxin
VPTDVTEATFERDVIQRSHERPVVVDFWADWCRPCHMLAPVIEKAVADRNGAVELVKVNTDENPRLSQAFRIQGIPAVKAFKDGRVVDEFVGAQPPQVVERFIDALLPSEADRLIESGTEEDLRRALELEPGRADAAIPLAKLLLERGDRDGALDVLSNVPGSFAAEGLAARIRLADLEDAFALLDTDVEAGIDALIAAIPESEGERREDLRRVIVGVLDELGVEHPVAREARRKLATALY